MSEATPAGQGDATSSAPATSVSFQPPATTTSGVTATVPAAPKPAPTSDDLGDAGKKAITEERAAKKAAEKRAAELQAKVNEFEKAKLSEKERAERELAEARAAAQAAREEAAQAQLDALRHKVAAAKGVPARHLVGATEDELTASADGLLEWRAAQVAPPKAPRPDPSVGSRGDTPLSGADLYRQMHPNRTPATTGQ